MTSPAQLQASGGRARLSYDRWFSTLIFLSFFLQRLSIRDASRDGPVFPLQIAASVRCGEQQFDGRSCGGKSPCDDDHERRATAAAAWILSGCGYCCGCGCGWGWRGSRIAAATCGKSRRSSRNSTSALYSQQLPRWTRTARHSAGYFHSVATCGRCGCCGCRTPKPARWTFNFRCNRRKSGCHHHDNRSRNHPPASDFRFFRRGPPESPTRLSPNLARIRKSSRNRTPILPVRFANQTLPVTSKLHLQRKSGLRFRQRPYPGTPLLPFRFRLSAPELKESQWSSLFYSCCLARLLLSKEAEMNIWCDFFGPDPKIS